MKRIFETLNNMSFILPDDYSLTNDKYTLPNGQGFINTENYLSNNGDVISFFEIHRQNKDFFDSYDKFCKDYKMISQKFELYRNFKIRLGDYLFPFYIIKGFNQKLVYFVQAFIDCGDCLGCLMFQISNVSENVKEMANKNKIFDDVIKILRSVR